MYEPAEDSHLLARVLKRYGRGRVLDIGTGSGILAQVAHDLGLSVLAVDNDPRVVLAHRQSSFRVIRSDGFSAVRGTFETIVCNPPYLPNDDTVHDEALHGGPKGYEYIVRIIAEAKHHLTTDGQLLFLISTLTKPAVVEQALLAEGYAWQIVDRENLFMEKLLVYRATLAIGEPAVYIGRGKRSVVYRVGSHAIKVSTSVRAKKEAQFLRRVNGLGIGPRFIATDGSRLVMRFVAGEPFDASMRKTRDVRVARAALRQARLLDGAGIDKKELSRPGKNILVTTSRRVVMLDFERSIYSRKPSNVTSLSQWLSRVLLCDQAAVRVALTAYKRSYTAAAFLAVLRSLQLSGKHPHRRAARRARP